MVSPLRTASAKLAGLYANGGQPTEEEVLDARRNLVMTRIQRELDLARTYGLDLGRKQQLIDEIKGL